MTVIHGRVSLFKVVHYCWELNSSSVSVNRNERNPCTVSPPPGTSLCALGSLGMVVGTTKTPISPVPSKPPLAPPRAYCPQALSVASPLQSELFPTLSLCLAARPFRVVGTCSALRSQLSSPTHRGLPNFSSETSPSYYFLKLLFVSVSEMTRFENILCLFNPRVYAPDNGYPLRPG